MNGVTDQPVDPARAERIKQLNEDLKRVREHKAQLLAQQKVLQQLQAAGGSKLPPSKQKAGDKRPGEPHDRESKRARIEADRRKRLDAMFSTCSNIIKNIKRSTDATPFMKPVDPIALGIPDYFNIVKQPMDLGTISQRLENKARQPRQYQSPLEFLGDMRLVWDNCRLYNRPGDQVRVMGDKLSDQFERRWEQAGIERKFQEHVEKCTREDREMEGQTPLKDKINAYDTSLKRHFENTPTQPGDSTKPMQFEQKRRLSVALGSLSGEHLAGVLQIVASSVPDNNSEEVELDMDSLDDGVLWKLEAYVNSKLTSKGKPAKAASGVSGAGPGVAAGAAAPAANGLPLGMKVDEDGMKAEGDAGASVQQEQDQAQGNAAAAPSAGAANGVPGPEPAAGAGEGAVKDDKASNSSSSSSSGSGSSSSTGSDSEEVVSKDNVGSTLGDPHGDAGKRQQSAAGGGEGLEASALVSATRPLPHQPQILKQTTSKKEIAIENAGAWAAMAAEAEGQDEEAGAEDANADGGQQPEGEDALWSEFMSREQQQQKRQEEELKEEERRRAEKEKEEEERARHEEKAKGEEEREKQAQLASKEREERERRDQLRAKEVAELQSMGETNQHADMGFTMDVAGVAAGEGQNGEDYDMD